MLLLLTLASFALNNPPPVQLSIAVSDTVKAKDQDSLTGTDTNQTLIRRAFQERPSYKSDSPLSGLRTDQRYLEGTIDSLLKKNPMLRGPLLRELLMPSDLFADFREPLALDIFNRRLDHDSKFTPFERMSLIAKRYALYNSSDRSLKSYQLDIRQTIRWWLEEVLK
jgi:hypothetical protein